MSIISRRNKCAGDITGTGEGTGAIGVIGAGTEGIGAGIAGTGGTGVGVVTGTAIAGDAIGSPVATILA
jgi:hypothetical protein